MNQSHVGVGADRSIRQRLRDWLPVIALAVLTIAFEAGGDVAREALRYERAGLEAGEWWRLVTAHLVHLGWGHLLLNLAALAVMRLLLEDAFSTLDWATAWLTAALGIAAGLYFLSPAVEWYVGLSGVLHGLLAAGSLALLRLHPALGGLLAVGLVAKLTWEQLAGPLPLSETTSGGPVVVDSHLYGAAAGALHGLVRFVPGRRAASL